MEWGWIEVGSPRKCWRQHLITSTTTRHDTTLQYLKVTYRVRCTKLDNIKIAKSRTESLTEYGSRCETSSTTLGCHSFLRSTNLGALSLHITCNICHERKMLNAKIIVQLFVSASQTGTRGTSYHGNNSIPGHQ